MDLIYTDETGKDIDIISAYVLDMAFGSDENNFELRMPITDHCLQKSYHIYMQDTEYGGIVDDIGASTEDDEVIYTGRTFHGILEKKIIQPDGDYLYLSGEANAVLGRLIALLDVTDIFESSAADSGIYIVNYKVPRYVPAYTAINNMLHEYGGKLLIRVSELGKAVLSAKPYINYFASEEWDRSEMSYCFTKKLNRINHLICAGLGNLSDRHVIHLFADENGAIQPYALTEHPLCDDDYILDTRHQKLFGSDEIMDFYDYGNAQMVENYIPVTKRPSDWAKSYTEYYYKSGDGYDQIEILTADEYWLLSAEPWDWKENYSSYYQKKADGYEEVSGQDETETYVVLDKKPSDWEESCGNYYLPDGSGGYCEIQESDADPALFNILNSMPADWNSNWGSYYYRYTDGVTCEYKEVEGQAGERFVYQTEKPSNWDTNYGSYYQRIMDNWKQVKGIEKTRIDGNNKVTIEETPDWQPNKGYATRYDYEYAPPWQQGMYYSKTESSVPSWKAGKFYGKITTYESAPEWSEGMYYTLHEDVEQIPDFSAETVYKKLEDHYAELISGALERFSEAADSVDTELEPDISYDIGDIVGCTDPITGISVAEVITKKIVTVDSAKGVSVEYNVGGKD